MRLWLLAVPRSEWRANEILQSAAGAYGAAYWAFKGLSGWRAGFCKKFYIFDISFCKSSYCKRAIISFQEVIAASQLRHVSFFPVRGTIPVALHCSLCHFIAKPLRDTLRIVRRFLAILETFTGNSVGIKVLLPTAINGFEY